MAICAGTYERWARESMVYHRDCLALKAGCVSMTKEDL